MSADSTPMAGSCFCGAVRFAAVSAEAFDDPTTFSFTQENFFDEKPDRYRFAIETVKMAGAEVFAAVAGGQGNGHG